MLIKNVTTEFTRRYSENMERTIIAFANSSGGKLFIGIDNDGTVCGVNDVDDTMLKVTNAVRDAIRPDVTMFTHCDCELIDNKAVMVVTVQRGPPDLLSFWKRNQAGRSFCTSGSIHCSCN